MNLQNPLVNQDISQLIVLFYQSLIFQCGVFLQPHFFIPSKKSVWAFRLKSNRCKVSVIDAIVVIKGNWLFLMNFMALS
jgi:hypothetical protein